MLPIIAKRERERHFIGHCVLIRALSQAERGNCRYDYYFAAEEPDDLLLVECWQTPEDQQAHCQTETFARLQELKAQYCDGVEIDKFEY